MTLSNEWNVTGPFPAGMRDYQFGAFPSRHSLNDLLTVGRTFPSVYGKNGSVTTYRTTSTTDPTTRRSQLSLSHPKVDWKTFRATAGWSALQWQCYASSLVTLSNSNSVQVTINVDKGFYFALLPLKDFKSGTKPIHWRNADVYSYNDVTASSDRWYGDSLGLPIRINLDRGIKEYIFLLRNVYEMRIFGDPLDEPPQIKISVYLQRDGSQTERKICTPPFAIVPTVIDGWLAGSGVSFAISNHESDPGSNWFYDNIRLLPEEVGFWFLPFQ